MYNIWILYIVHVVYLQNIYSIYVYICIYICIYILYIYIYMYIQYICDMMIEASEGGCSRNILRKVNVCKHFS